MLVVKRKKRRKKKMCNSNNFTKESEPLWSPNTEENLYWSETRLEITGLTSVTTIVGSVARNFIFIYRKKKKHGLWLSQKRKKILHSCALNLSWFIPIQKHFSADCGGFQFEVPSTNIIINWPWYFWWKGQKRSHTLNTVKSSQHLKPGNPEP